MKEIYKLEDKLSELKIFAEKGLEDLKSTGLASVDKLFMLKKGYPLFIAGNPGHGKTEFVFEILVNTSMMYGWKHFIYCGEGGNIEHIFYELVNKYLEKSYHYVSEQEKIKAEYFISSHFIIANHDNDYTIAAFYDLANKVQNDLGITFDTTTFDPFNDIEDESQRFGGRDDKYLAYALKRCRIDAKKQNRINILINHVSDIPPKTDKDSGMDYLPAALPTQWAGGRTWWRRAFTMIVIYRPYTFRKDANGKPFEENETHVIVQKTKPKGIGRNGTASIFWDYKRNRYYSFDEYNQVLYSTEKNIYKQAAIQPAKDFTISNRIETDDNLPF